MFVRVKRRQKLDKHRIHPHPVQVLSRNYLDNQEAMSMNAALFEPRPLYGIGTVARLTGLKPDTLRVWERRYGLGASHKSTTGRRRIGKKNAGDAPQAARCASS